MDLTKSEIEALLKLIDRELQYYSRKEAEARTDYRRKYWTDQAKELNAIKEKLEAAE